MIAIDLALPLARFELTAAFETGSDAVAILGPSGSGKTSLLECVAGLRQGARGRVALDGEALLDTSRHVNVAPERRRVGYVPQDAALFPHLDVRQNLRFGLAPGADLEAIAALLELGPLLRRSPRTLSGGERQRVALGRALATSPRLLLLDEPLAALDVELKERILPYLLRVRDEAKVPILYVTHHAGEALALAREAVLLRDGKVEARGAPREVLTLRRLAGLGDAGPLENVLDGRLAAHDTEHGTSVLEVAGVRLAVPASPELAPGARAAWAVAAEDVLVATHPIEGISARNVLAGAVSALEVSGAEAIVRARVGELELMARLTAASARELGLAPGRPVWLVLKTHALRRLR